MSLHMNPRETIESLTVEKILSPEGPDILLSTGRAIFSLAARKENRATYDIGKHTDLASKKTIVSWNRNFADGHHSVFTTAWGRRSYALYDLHHPEPDVRGNVRVFLYGNDSTIKGLRRAIDNVHVSSLESLPDQGTLEQMVGSYSRHPTGQRQEPNRPQAAAFLWLVKGIFK